jgi:hypothetical protein
MSQTGKSKMHTLGTFAAGTIVALAAALPFSAMANEADNGARLDTSSEGRRDCARRDCAVDFNAGAAGEALQLRQDRKTSGSAAFDASTHESGLIGKIRRKL